MMYRLFRGYLPKAVNPQFYLTRMLRRMDPLRAASELLRSALNVLTDDLLIVDTQGRVVLANRRFADLLGQTRQTLIGQSLDTLAWQDSHGEPLGAGTYPWEIALQRGATTRLNRLWLTDSHGVRRAFLANCSPLPVGDGKCGGAMISLDEIAGLDADKIEPHRPVHKVDGGTYAASLALADTAHEIRSSLNATLGFTELLRRGQFKDDADYRCHLDIVHSSSRHLLELVNGILDISSAESGALEVKLGDCAPYRIAHEVVQAESVRACGRRASIELVCPGSIPACIQSDPARLHQIVGHLVRHVTAYSSGGDVKLVLRFIAARPQAQLLFEISSNETAEGKPKTPIEPSIQAGLATARRLGGAGLGLTLSLRLARAIGAELVMRRVPGVARTFVLKLPAGPIEAIRLITPEQAASQQGGANPAVGSHWKLSPARVLIVDDAPENRELVRLVMEDAGAVTEQAENGLTAVEKARSRHYDLILMDLHMPGADGATATRLLRQYGLKAPIVALTAHSLKNLEQELIDAGFTAYLAKPIEIDRLLATDASLVGGTRVCQPLNKLAALPIKPVYGSNLPQLPIVSRLAGNPRLQAAINKFLARLGGQLSAIELAWQARDFETLASLAHWLKGAGGTVGFDSFNEPAKRLEQLSKTKQADDMEEVLMELKDISARIVRPQVAASTSTPGPEQTRVKP